MKAFIKGIGNISPQHTWSGDFLSLPVGYKQNLLDCIEPDHTQWINPQQLRRMSRVLKIGTTAAFMALKDADIKIPDAIITGTGYGCLEDTKTFLTKITELQETALNPTPFMQSTHNTIGSQIALLLQCQGYNQTYVQDAFSFEHALLDTMLQLEENPDQHILTGGVDELTSTSHSIQSRFGIYRQVVNDSLKIIEHPAKGTIHGEGAAWFVLSGVNKGRSLAAVSGIRTFFQPTVKKLVEGTSALLREALIDKNSIDLVLVGKSGDDNSDQLTDSLVQTIFPHQAIGYYKHLCGEHCAASAFAMWLGSRILDEQHVPEIVKPSRYPGSLKNVLIYNPYFYDHHSLILLTSCHDSKQ